MAKKDGHLKPIVFASIYLNDTKKRFAARELELRGIVLESERFGLFMCSESR